MNARRPEQVSQHLSTFALEAYLLDGEDAKRRTQVESHLRECERCRDAIAELRRLHAEFNQELLPSGPPVSSVAVQESPWYRKATLIAPLLASAAAVALFATWVGDDGLQSSPTPAIQAKGESTFIVLARRGERVFQLDPQGNDLQPGDALRFVLTTGGANEGYLIVASVDEDNNTNIYFPQEGQDGRISQPGRWELPGSVVLDDKSGSERVFALLSKQRLKPEDVRRALTELGRGGASRLQVDKPLELPTSSQYSFLIRKRAP